MSIKKPDHGLYRFDATKHRNMVAIWQEKFGTGPFLVIKKYTRRGYPKYTVRNIQTGKEYAGWGDPESWGVKDKFLSAAYRANDPNE